MGYAPADNPQIAIYVVVDRPNAVFQDDAKYATRVVRSILTEVLPYMNIYMTEELSDSEREELDSLNITIKKASVLEEVEEAEEETTEYETDEDGVIDARGGDTTSSTHLSDEEMQSDNADTAPLTGTMLSDNSDQEDTSDGRW